MWERLPKNKKNEYKRMILAFASLTEMFSQKTDDIGSLAPIINSKYQETMFREAFDAVIEDIGNTSYDASLNLVSDDDSEVKALVGIKTFGIASGAQKVAQFKSEHAALTNLINSIEANALDKNRNPRTKSEIDELNYENYKQIAMRISQIRNDRIRSSKESIRGFRVKETDTEVESVYHVLMPSRKGDAPKIFVGETSYDEISIPDIKILGCTSSKTPLNFSFTDGNHDYKFTVADTQLYMDFHNSDIVKEEWDVIYATDPYGFFSRLADYLFGMVDRGLLPVSTSGKPVMREPNIMEGFCWPLLNSDGEAELFSGFNAFYGVGSKLGEKQRRQAVIKLQAEFEDIVEKNILKEVIAGVRDFLFQRAPTYVEKVEKATKREEIMELVESAGNSDFSKKVEKLLFRPMNELYIPVPNAREFHSEHPDFFAPDAGRLIEGTNKLALPKSLRTFNLIFEPSGEMLQAFITQNTGKAIESVDKQTYLGEWILRKVFQLNEREPLTAERMEQIGINGIYLYRTDADNAVHIRFVWLDKNGQIASEI